MRKIIDFIGNGTIAKNIADNQHYRIVLTAALSLSLNLIYALYNGVLGVITHSLWFLTMFSYYAIISVMRFSAVLFEHRRAYVKSDTSEAFVMKFCGIWLILLAIIISSSVYLSFALKTGVGYHEIIMITIATYTFCKATLAIINVIKIRKRNSMLLLTIRYISCADAAVSMLSLQRSMIASFGNLYTRESVILTSVFGAAVCGYVAVLGGRMIFAASKKRKED
ncbi:MAG: hypothetical protein J6C82_06810 [Clostridia bacterium]|nr:hypothetical protein [Clostridia bacterium]